MGSVIQRLVERSWDKRAEGRRISGSSPSASPLETHAVNNEPRLSFAPKYEDDGFEKGTNL